MATFICMRYTKIRWADHTWNNMVGCTRISPGCDHCYAETIATKFQGPAFPNGFDPTFKPQKLDEPRKLSRRPGRIFVNSMSDVFHEAFTEDQVDQVFDRMVAWPMHDYLLLTKRPQRMAKYIPGWLERRGMERVPEWIWLGTSIESDKYTWRANHLRNIPVTVRFLSLEPLLGPLPSLDLTGIAWAIVGGESGPGYRPMDHQWARDIRLNALSMGTAFYFKQSAAPRTEMGMELDGKRYEAYPFQHPALHGGDRVLGHWLDDAPAIEASWERTAGQKLPKPALR